MKTMIAVALALMAGVFNTSAWGQITVFADDFSTNTSATYTTSGAIGSSAWSVTRNAADWGARRNTSPLQLELTNDASATANANGWVFAHTATSSFSSPYNTTLDQNSGIVTWYFNMRQIRTDPAGFLSPSYAVAFVLGATSTAITTAGTNGYAVVLGNTGSTDPVRLVKFTSGITSLGNTAPPTANDLIVSNTSGLTDFGTDYLSVKVTYNPASDEWELFLRNDGGSAFADPASGSLTSQGTAIDNAYTGVALGEMGGYWQGSTAANQTAFFDNVSVLVTPFLFRSAASGNWNSTLTWEQSTDNGSSWGSAVSTPTATNGSVTIQTGDDVTVTAGVAVDELMIESGSTLHVNNGATLTVQNGTGDDITVNGTLSTAGSINGTGTIAVNGGVFRIDEGGWGGSTNVYTYDATSTLVFNNASSFYGVGSGAVWWPDPISNVTVQNTGGVELNTSRTVTGLFQTSTGVKNTFGNNLIVSGTLQLNGGGYFDNFSPTYTSTGLLVYNANYGVYNEWTGWSATPGYGVPAGIVIQNGATVTMPAAARGLGGDMNIANGTLVRNASFQLSMTGNWIRAAGSFHTHNNAPLVLPGTAVQTVTADGGEVFGSLDIYNAAGVTLNSDVTVTQGLTLSNGIVTTGANALTVSAAATVSRTAGHVHGTLEKEYGTGSQSFTYHIGGGSLYTPVALSNFGVTAAGTVAAATTAGEHPNVGTSNINSSKNVNRYWTLTKDGSLAFTSYDATFSFDGSEIDGGANTAAFEVEKYDGSWSALTVGTRTGTSTEVVGATSFSDFIIGESMAGPLDHFLVEAFGGGPIGTQTAGVPFAVRITAQDASNNTVTSFTGTVEITSSGFLSAGGGATATFVAGVLASHNVTITNTGNFTITATETGDTPDGTSNAFDVDPATLDNFLVEQAGGGSIPSQDAGVSFNIRITARDAFNNTVTGFVGTVDITSSGTLSLGGGATAGFTAGVLASHGVTISDAGTFDITATRTGGSESGTSNTFVVNPGGLDNFLVEAFGGGAIGAQTAGIPFNIRVTARDASNNTVTGFTGTVDITSSGTLLAGGGTTASFVAGVLASHSVTISNTGSFDITATNTFGAQNGTSNTFAVNAGSLAGFLVEAAGGGAIGAQVAGTTFNIQVTAQDAFGNTVTAFGGTTDITSSGTLLIGSGPTAAFTSGFLGSHAVAISNTGTFDITATETGDTPAGTSNLFVVNPGALDNFLVEAAGGGAIPDQDAGTPFTVQITARDAYNNTVTGFTSTVDITSSGTLMTGAGTTAGFTAGFLASHSVAISNPGFFTITSTHSFGPEFGTSNGFNVNVGPLDNFLVELAGGGPIGTQTAGVPFNIQVTARDAGGNTVTAFTGTTDITSSGTISAGGGATGSFIGGVLASHAVTITSAGNFTITATETGDTPSGTSNAFDVDPAALSAFVVEAAGGGAIGSQSAGVPFAIDVTAADAFGNTVTGFVGTVDVTSGGPIASGGGTTAGFIAGVLSAHTITINVAGLYSLDAELTGGGPNGVSNAFSVSHAALSKFLVEADGGGTIPSQVAGAPFDIQVTAQDAFDNTVTSFGSTVEITSSGTILSGGGTTSSFTAGVLATHAVAISNTGNFTITATHTFGLEDGTSNLFAVDPGPLDNYLVEAFGGGAIPSQAAGVAFDIQVTARDAFNNTVPSFVGTVDITSTGLLAAGGGTTGGFTAGVLATHNVEISNTGSFTITATTTGGPEDGTSNLFAVDAGPLDHFLVEADGGGAVGTQTAGVAFAIEVTARDINGNLVGGFGGTVDITSTGTLSAGGGTTGVFTAGVLAAHNVTITNTGSFDITATRTGGTEEGTSNLFNVEAGPLSHFIVEAAGGGLIGTQTAGTPFAIQVTARDAFSNTVAAFTGTADITTGGVLVSGGGTTGAFTAGVLVSHNVIFSSAGMFDLTATATGGPETGTSNSFFVDPGPLTTFLVEEDGGGPIGVQAVGAPFNIQVTAKDMFGNTVPAFTGTVDITTTGSFLSGGGTTVPFVGGFLAPHAVNFATAGNFTISAKRTGGPEIGASNIFTVTATFFTILATADSNGTIFPAGAVTAPYGANRTFTMAPAPGYQIDEVFVDGLPVGDDPTYTFVNVTTDHTIHVTFEPNTKFLTIPPDSIIAKDPLTNKIYKPVKRGRGKMPNWANLLSEAVIQGGFQPNATESDGAGGMRIGIAHMGEVQTNKWKPHVDSARIRGWVRLTKWDFRKSIGKPFSILQKTLKDRTGEHVGEARGFDYLGPETNQKLFVKQWTNLPPKRHNNELYAELVALKLNIAASQLGKTPIGLGELIYENDGHPCDELTIVEISAKADTAMTYWLGRDDQEYADLFDAIYDINRAFVGEVDTVYFVNGGQLVLRGEVDIEDVPFLKPAVIAARQLPRTSDETEAGDDDFDDDEFEDGMPVAAKLYQNYPNPFNPSTTIAFRLREGSVVTLKIYNMLGQEVAALLEGEEMDEGLQLLQFNAGGMATGVYFYRIDARGIDEEGLETVQTGKMLLIK